MQGVPEGEPKFSKDHKRNQNRVDYSQVLEEIHNRPEGTCAGVQARCRWRERQDLGHTPVFGSVDKVLCGSQAKARLVNLNQKRTGLW